ncbi:hypothetical protein Tsubulata_034769 [Turnera subulata]|uniref:Tobamovirus multiplication protein 2B n=1 Tax=Turnera subulata TaxID=218843 RepID=A0A9Q0F8L7_9ROSI|nr:hypothetical protein Tsubulata_034769 [Turnera subulata]
MERAMANTASYGGGSVRGTASSSREGTAKATVAEQISQSIQSTSNLLHLMQQSSPSQAYYTHTFSLYITFSLFFFNRISDALLVYLMWYYYHLIEEQKAQLSKLPKNLLAKASTIKNTGQVLEQMPRVISALDAHMESGLQSVPHLQTVIQLLANMESSQLNSLSRSHLLQKEAELSNQHSKTG